MIALSSRFTYLLLGLLLLLALGLRLYRVGTYGIYFDEKATLLVSQSIVMEGFNQRDVFDKPYFTPAEFWKPKTFTDFMEADTRSDIGNSPAYYAVVWGWLKLFGMSDTSLRMPSVIFSTLLIGLLFVFVRRHFRFLGEARVNALALLSAFIATIEPFFVAYSHIARNYPMTFFLTLLATHLFLLIMERVRQPSLSSASAGPVGLYVAYGLVFVTSVFSHYLTVTVFLCHGLYALLFLRNGRAWLSLGLTAGLGLGIVSLWFLFGGGQYTFFTLNYQAQFYRNIALTNPTGSPFGLILPATFPNIAVRGIPIFADLFMPTNGIGQAMTGIRNSALALALGLGATAVLHRYWSARVVPVWAYVAIPVLLLAGLPIYSVVPERLLVLSGAVPFVYLIGRYVYDRFDRAQRPLITLLLLLAFVPTLFLLFMAWRSGHTFGITQRYSGFSFPYVCILVAMGLQQLASARWWLAAPIAAVLVLQLVHIGKLLGSIYADEAPKYTYFDRPRIANPYWQAAQQLISTYQPGDTILYPNKKRVIYSQAIDKTYTPLSLLDAQLMNVYLPASATYIQRIDPAEPDRIVLVKGQTGARITIFDFKGSIYRYGD